MNCENNAHGQREIEAVSSLLAQAAVLLDESRALSYALIRCWHVPRAKTYRAEEIDGLCQLAYELLNKLTKTSEVFQEARQTLDERLRRRSCCGDNDLAAPANS